MSVILKKEICESSEEMRKVYGDVIVDMINAGEPVVTMDCDLMRAIGLLPYRDKYPGRFVDCGIAEQNMMGVAAGLSAEGFIPFPHTFGVFASRRAYDQIFMSGSYAKLNVKVIGSDPGVMAGLNGGTHQAFEDVALMRAIPEITIIEPTDTTMLKQLIRDAAHTYGMFYIRMTRVKVPVIYEEGSEFTIGKAVTVREGTDVTIIASGVEVVEAIKAADILAEQGVSARVLDMFTIKPIDEEAILKAACETGAIVTAENHQIIGGLGSAVAEVLAAKKPTPLERVGVLDRFGEVGKTPWLKECFHLTANDIVEKALVAISRK